jgi:hypothetical protein
MGRAHRQRIGYRLIRVISSCGVSRESSKRYSAKSSTGARQELASRVQSLDGTRTR